MTVKRYEGIELTRKVLKFRSEKDARRSMHELKAKGAEEMSDFETRALGGRKFRLDGDVYYLYVQ